MNGNNLQKIFAPGSCATWSVKISAHQATKLSRLHTHIKLQPYSNTFLQTGKKEADSADGFKTQQTMDFLIQKAFWWGVGVGG
jgi:hypothetical protein